MSNRKTRDAMKISGASYFKNFLRGRKCWVNNIGDILQARGMRFALNLSIPERGLV